MFGLDGIHLLLLIGLVALYFLPTIVARSNKHSKKGAILLLNILVGWTLIGWIACFIWASIDNKQTSTIEDYASPQKIKACPFCKKEIDIEASKCPYCQEWIKDTQENDARAAGETGQQKTREVILTKKCPSCGFMNHPSNTKCLNCEKFLF